MRLQYTSGGTVYFITPPGNPQHVPHFVKYTNTGYQPVNKYYATSSANPNQGCSSDRPLPARELAELIMHSRKDHLPEWKLAQFHGNPLHWHDWFGQFKSTYDSAVLTDDTKSTLILILKTLITGKEKNAIAEFNYRGVIYMDALATLQRNLGQTHAFVGAHLDKWNTFPPLRTNISGLVAVLKSLSLYDELKSVNMLSPAVSKLPPNLKKA